MGWYANTRAVVTMDFYPQGLVGFAMSYPLDASNNLMTMDDAAENLGVSIATLRNWYRTGKLPAECSPFDVAPVYSRDAFKARLDQLQRKGLRPPTQATVLSGTVVFECGSGDCEL